MRISVKEMVKQNNEKRKLLSDENENYYENMLVYIRTNAFRDERATEEVLLEMLDHLLEAQKEGKSAEEVFGKSPKELAEKIIQSLPKESVKGFIEFSFEIGLTVFGWFLAVWGIMPMIHQQDQTAYLGSVGLSALLLLGSLVLLLYLGFGMIRKNAFSNQKKKKAMAWVFGVLVALLFSGGISINLLMKPFGPEIEISYYTPFGLGCFFLLAAYILKKSREAK